MPQETEIKKLHPTLKKCKCGFIGVRPAWWKHYENERPVKHENKVVNEMRLIAFYGMHGEVPINEDEGDAFLNARWLEGTPKGYND